MLHFKTLVEFLILVSIVNKMLISYPAPYWMEHGSYLEYGGRISHIFFYHLLFNKTTIHKQLFSIAGVEVLRSDSNIDGLSFKEEIDVHVSLLIEDLNGSTGLFKVTLTVGPYNSTKNLLIDLLTKQVTLPDGTPLGQTTIWIQPCKVGDRIPFVGQGNTTVFAKASDVSFRDTVQSVQDCIVLDVSEHQWKGYVGVYFNLSPPETQTIKFFNPRINYYDADTFIMIEGDIDEDALLSAFGIAGFFGRSFKLTSTNIDLGPPNLLMTLLRLLPYLVPLTIFLIAIIYFILIKKRGIGT